MLVRQMTFIKVRVKLCLRWEQADAEKKKSTIEK